MSQEALADAAHVHITLLGPLERGTGNPNYATLVKLARALSMTPGKLIARADDIARTRPAGPLPDSVPPQRKRRSARSR